jgi:hypothetical protein
MTDLPDGSGPPHEDTGPPPDPDPDEGLSPVWQARYAHGAKVTLPAAEKIRFFTLKIVTNNNNNANTTTSSTRNTVNAHSVHKEFIQAFFDLAECDLQFLPTIETPDPDHIMPGPLITKQSFPTTDQLHLAFFHRQVIVDQSQKFTIIRIKHQVLMKTTLADIKTKLKPWLIKNKATMSGGDLIATDTSVIAWLPELHPRMVWRPDIADHFNSQVRLHPRLHAIISEYFPDDDIPEIPLLFCNMRTIRMGGVSSEALAITCVMNRSAMMKEIISSDDFPSNINIIPTGFTQVCGPKAESEWLKINNDFTNRVQGLSIDGFSEEFLDTSVHLDDDTYPTTRELILRSKAIISIERTKSTDNIGRYLLIVYRNLFQSAHDHINMVCQDIFPSVYDSPASIATYRSNYLQVPRITAAANAGGSVATRSKKMEKLLQSKIQSTATSNPTSSYAEITRTKVVFDLQSEFPTLNSPTASTPTPNNPPDSTTIASDGSSTLGTGIPRNTSASIVSTDISTIVGSITSELKSMFTEQSTENRKFQQELFDKQAIKDEQIRLHQVALLAQQAAKDEQIRLFNQNLLTQVTAGQQILANLVTHLFPTAPTQPTPLPNTTPFSPSIPLLQTDIPTLPDSVDMPPKTPNQDLASSISAQKGDPQNTTHFTTSATQADQQPPAPTTHEPTKVYHSTPITIPRSERPSARNQPQGRGRGHSNAPTITTPKLSQTSLHTYKRPPPPKPISAAAFPDPNAPQNTPKTPPTHDESHTKRSRPAGTTPTKLFNSSQDTTTENNPPHQMVFDTPDSPSTPPPPDPTLTDTPMTNSQDPGTPLSSNTTRSD